MAATIEREPAAVMAERTGGHARTRRPARSSAVAGARASLDTRRRQHAPSRPSPCRSCAHPVAVTVNRRAITSDRNGHRSRMRRAHEAIARRSWPERARFTSGRDTFPVRTRAVREEHAGSAPAIRRGSPNAGDTIRIGSPTRRGDTTGRSRCVRAAHGRCSRRDRSHHGRRMLGSARRAQRVTGGILASSPASFSASWVRAAWSARSSPTPVAEIASVSSVRRLPVHTSNTCRRPRASYQTR